MESLVIDGDVALEEALCLINGTPTADAAARYIDRIEGEVRELQIDNIRALLDHVFADSLIERDFPSVIRKITTMVQVSERIAERLGIAGVIENMTIGDISRLPDFVGPAKRAVSARVAPIQRALTEKYGGGYDLTGQGCLEAREAFVRRVMQPHYGFRTEVAQRMARNSVVVAGGMQGLNGLIQYLARFAATSGRYPPFENKVAQKPRFIYPDNSFGTWPTLLALHRLEDSMYRRPSRQESRLHFTDIDIHSFYSEHGCSDAFLDIFYITPVGNPSGTVQRSDDLRGMLKAIYSHNPRAIVILDAVYVRTLSETSAKELMASVFEVPGNLDRMIILESLSKTHGFPRERLGFVTVPGDELASEIIAGNMLAGAGNGGIKDAQFLAASCLLPSEKECFERLYRHWAEERADLWSYLSGHPAARRLFHPNQSHLDRPLDEPGGLYLCVRLQDGITPIDVGIATQCFGVPQQLAKNEYVRFSLGGVLRSGACASLSSDGGSRV